ncbi:OmcA/MtrC family decaheme c-type cytochrome [Vibrio sp. CAU 1672]|uniref:OmcA/MtrC family decaheme c-type cytochrome n=1 Tax=Vibrio sp. CAU 1672 TaxID=3032594 RepID=UPI0023DAD9A0|nr:OmcA/MtrC family decaheme c-type cytochrome [Vibrio sp. CAU 1672]MDF2152404.1 OmcA/MtrC family decaheme c-type cytochrome [Vibrio sp. CAU 1672]
MNNIKSILITILGFFLVACGPDSKNDQNAPPPDINAFSISIDTPSLIPSETGSETKLVVNFSVVDGAGRDYSLDQEKDFRIAVLKAMPARSDTEDGTDPAFAFNGRHGNTFWKSFHHSSNEPNNKARMESVWDGDLVKTETGYRYTFAIPDILKVADPYPADSTTNNGYIAWDEDKLHRIVMAYGDQALGFTHVYEWQPNAESDAAVTRNVIGQGTCETCHMGEPLYHGPGYRSIDNNIAVCTSCHNDSNPGAAPSRRPLAAVVHQYHGNIFKLGSDRNNLTTYKQPVDENEQLVADINGLVVEGNPFPQDARNCTTCHTNDVTLASDAKNWFEHPTQVACETCHLFRDRGAHDNQIGTAWVRDGSPQNTCTGCHRPYERDDNGEPIIGQDASRSARTVHTMRLANLAAARDSLQVNIEQARFVDQSFEILVHVSKDGVGVKTLDEITPFINEHGHLNLLLNWDDGLGPVLANNDLDMTEDGTSGDGCVAEGNGRFSCHKDFSDSAALPGATSKLTVNMADMPLCADRKTAALTNCDSFTGIDLLNYPFVIAANNASGAFDTGGVAVSHRLPVGADIDSCNDCHKELTIHKLGAHPHAATDFQQCKNCHNSERSAYYPGMAADLKYHVHSLHTYGSNRSGDPEYPGAINNCEACHTKSQYNLPSTENTRPSLASDKYFSPALVACGACHLESAIANADPDNVAGDAILTHMLNNGAVFAADTAAEATGTEQCASCHAVGQAQGVDKVHHVYDYR